MIYPPYETPIRPRPQTPVEGMASRPGTVASAGTRSRRGAPSPASRSVAGGDDFHLGVASFWALRCKVTEIVTIVRARHFRSHPVAGRVLEVVQDLATRYDDPISVCPTPGHRITQVLNRQLDNLKRLEHSLAATPAAYWMGLMSNSIFSSAANSRLQLIRRHLDQIRAWDLELQSELDDLQSSDHIGDM